MNMSERITTIVDSLAPAAGTSSPAERVRTALHELAMSLFNALPAVLALGLLLGIWELVCRGPGAALPPPSQVIADTRCTESARVGRAPSRARPADRYR